jgi:hypothetical protein
VAAAARVAPPAWARYRFGQTVHFSKEGSAIVSSRHSASFILLAALSLACGARSGIECFGESCSRSADDDEQQGLAPDDEDEDDEPGLRPPFDTGGSGGQPGRPRPSDDEPFPEQIPTETPIDMPSSSFCPTGGTFNGSVDVSDTATLEALRGCTAIDGDLVIFGGNISDLEPLSQLRLVDGELRFTSYLGSLTGLEALESVDALTIQNSNMSTLEPLRGLRRIDVSRRAGSGKLLLTNNPGLTSLDGLGSIQELASVDISENVGLATLAGLNVPAQLTTISIRSNPLLTDVVGLANLQLVETIEIEDSPSLPSLGALSNLQAADSLVLVNNPNLADLNVPLGSIRVLYLESVGLTTLNGLSSLARVDSAVIQNNPNLLEIDRLGAVETLTELSVINNPSLIQMPEFAGSVLDQLHVRSNLSLAVGPAYPRVLEAGTILIAENPSLANLTGFATLESVRSLDISRNRSLVGLSLQGLLNARSLRIICNEQLLESSLQSELGDVAGAVDVWGNQGSPAPCTLPL